MAKFGLIICQNAIVDYLHIHVCQPFEPGGQRLYNSFLLKFPVTFING